jgi:hypothetical protein
MSARPATNATRITALESKIDMLIAALMPENAPAKAADPEWVEIATHVHDARMVRRATTTLGGLTSVERKALAATMPKGYTREQWTAAVVAHKAATA